MGINRDAAWLLMFALRVLSAAMFFARAFTHGDVGCFCWALVELHAIALAGLNEWSKHSADRSAGGVLVPLLYLAGAFTAPMGSSSLVGQTAIAIAAGVVFAVRCYLGLSYSVGGSTWSRLVDRGPYKWIRHPMLCCQVLARVVIVAEFPSTLNLVTLAIFIAAMIAVIIIEERFLKTFAEYRAYVGRVRYRLLPFVW